MNEEGQGPYRMQFAILAFNRSLKCKSSCIINCIKYNQMIKLEQLVNKQVICQQQYSQRKVYKIKHPVIVR